MYNVGRLCLVVFGYCGEFKNQTWLTYVGLGSCFVLIGLGMINIVVFMLTKFDYVCHVVGLQIGLDFIETCWHVLGCMLRYYFIHYWLGHYQKLELIAMFYISIGLDFFKHCMPKLKRVFYDPWFNSWIVIALGGWVPVT